MFAESLIAKARVDHDQATIDWTVIVGFYSALHLVAAELANHGLHPRTLKERSDQLLAVSADSDMCRAYDILQTMSEQARYGMRHFDFEAVEYQVFGVYLPRVQRVVLGSVL